MGLHVKIGGSSGGRQGGEGGDKRSWTRERVCAVRLPEGCRVAVEAGRADGEEKKNNRKNRGETYRLV